MWASNGLVGYAKWSVRSVCSQPAVLASEGAAGGMPYVAARCKMKACLWTQDMLWNTGSAWEYRSTTCNLGKFFLKLKLRILRMPKLIWHTTGVSFQLGMNCQRTWLWNKERGKRTPFKESRIWDETLQSIIQQTIFPRDFQKLGCFNKDEFNPRFSETQEALAPVMSFSFFPVYILWSECLFSKFCNPFSK